jgi:hypothetical protein
MPEDPFDRAGLFDECNKPQPASTARTLEHVESNVSAGNNGVNGTRGLRPRRGATLGMPREPISCAHAARNPLGGSGGASRRTGALRPHCVWEWCRIPSVNTDSV